MIVVIDTNTTFSGMLNRRGCPGHIYDAWIDGVFELATCEEQLQELREASRRPQLADRLNRADVGFTINRLRMSLFFEPKRLHSAVDPTDSYLLDLAVAAKAHFLITGDKRSGLLQRRRIEQTRILKPSEFCSSVLKLQL